MNQEEKEKLIAQFKENIYYDNYTPKFYEIFELKCKKCGSCDIEAFGDYNNSGVYYAGEVGVTTLVIKCHACGNAFAWSGYGIQDDIANDINERPK